MTKYIFITGGVISTLGKGVLTASIARILKLGGISVSAMKIDPYLNSDAGTLNPFEHGEVFVTQDGFECDMDIGHYERFLGVPAKKGQNLMMGAVYGAIISAERMGSFLGKTIQAIPHVTDEIKRRIKAASKEVGCDVLCVEIGGTVGDIEGELVLEAARQLKYVEGNNAAFVHLAPLLTTATGEMKTKALQHSVKELLARGIVPDIIVARTRDCITQEARSKIALQCNVKQSDIFYAPDVQSIYLLPSVLLSQGIQRSIAEKLNLDIKSVNTKVWDKIVRRALASKKIKKVAIVGKYTVSKDAYASIYEALFHAGAAVGIKIVADLIDAEKLERECANFANFAGYDGIIVPGGFGLRGTEGKISAIKWARENCVPFLGICFGFQLTVIEYARNVLKMHGASSAELDPKTKYPVIDILPEQIGIEKKGGTMRLGAQTIIIKRGTLARKIYMQEKILKRHRHRYEVNPAYIEALQKGGLIFSGISDDGKKMEILELRNHPFFLATQFHPEFDSRLEAPEPAFLAFAKKL